MALSEARKRANAKYNAKAYEQITLRVSKGEKEKIRIFAESKNQSLNAFILSAIKKAMNED